MKILVATDGSEFGESAVTECCRLIELGVASSVTVITIYEAQVPMPAEPLAISAEHYQRLDAMANERAKAIASDAAAKIREAAGDPNFGVATIVDVGRPAQKIVESATDIGAEIVVVGSHGRGFWGRLTLGSVSDSVVHHSPCSVLVVRPKKAKV